MKHFLLVWAICSTAIFAKAQQFQYRQYTTEDGLGHNQVFCIYQDTLGFMWMGTDDGLFRFDGQSFFDMSRVDSVFEGSFTLLQASEKEGFWAGIYKKKLINITPASTKSYIKQSITIPAGSDMIENEDRLLTSFAKVVYNWEGDSVQLLHFRKWFWELYPELSRDLIFKPTIRVRLFKAPDGRTKMINYFGVFDLDGVDASIDIDTLSKIEINCHGYRDQKSYWLGGKGMVYLIKDNQLVSTISHPSWQGKVIHFLLQDSEENLWISVKEGGVFMMKPEGEIQFMGDQLGLGDEFANYIFEDKDYAIWFATTLKGVFRVEKTLFEKIEIPPGESSISALELSNEGDLWVGADNQIYQLSDNKKTIPLLSTRLKGEIQSFNKGKDKTYVSVLSDSTLGLLNPVNKVRDDLYAITSSSTSFLDDQTLLVWFGLNYKFIDSIKGPIRTWRIKANGDLKILETFTYSDNVLWRTYKTNQTLVNQDGSIWVAQNQGLYHWSQIGDFEAKPVLNHDSKDIIRHPEGGIICASSKGVYWVTPENDSSSHLMYGGISATSILFDQEQRLWVGSQDGLYLFDLKGKQLIPSSKFLKSFTINCLTFDETKNRLWIGTDQGLFQTNTQKITSNFQEIPTMVVSELVTEDSTYLFPQDVTLSSANNYLNFRFSGLEFRDPAALKITYRLNQHPWQEIRSSELQFAALADGKYTLELRASNDALEWSKPKVVNFEISPPFWKSPWFYALASIFSVFLIGFLAWRRIINVKKREKEKRYLQAKLTELEQQALGAMMNPHFIFNTLNSIQHFFNQNDPAEANEYLARFAQLIRLNMEVVQQPLIPLDEELDRLQIYLDLEQLRFGDKMSYKLDIEPDIDLEEIMIPSMLMQPFVENAIWHGITPKQEKGWVHVELKMIEDETLRIRIDDNGPGVFSQQKIKKSAHTSRGVDITRSRLHHYSPKARLTFSERKDTDGKVLGTQVELRLPV